MRFDQNRENIAFLERLRAVFSDPKVLDSAVYRAGLICDGTGQPVALSTSDLWHVWSVKGEVEKEALAKAELSIAMPLGRDEIGVIDGMLTSFSLTTRQRIVLLSAIITIANEMDREGKEAQRKWAACLPQASETMLGEDESRYLAYIKEKIESANVDVFSVIDKWLKTQTEIVFCPDNQDMLSDDSFEIFQDCDSNFNSVSLSPDVLDVAEGGLPLFELLEKEIECVFLFGTDIPPFYFPEGQSESQSLALINRLQLDAKPINQVGRIITYKVIFEGHSFLLHHSGEVLISLTEEERRYLYVMNEQRVSRNLSAVRIGGADEVFKEKKDSHFEEQSPVAITLYRMAIQQIEKKMDEVDSELEDDGLLSDIASLKVILSKLKLNDEKFLSQLDSLLLVPDELKEVSPCKVAHLLIYLIKQIPSSLVKEQTYLLSTLTNPIVFDEKEQGELFSKLERYLGEEAFFDLAPYLLCAGLDNYLDFLTLHADMDPDEKTLQRFADSIGGYIDISLHLIRQGLINSDNLDAVRVWMTLLKKAVQTYFDSVVLLDETSPLKIKLHQEIRKLNDALDTYDKVCVLSDKIDHNDYVFLLRLEQKLKRIMTCHDEKSENLTEDEEQLLLKYDDCFQDLETTSFAKETIQEKMHILSQDMNEARAVFLNKASIADDQKEIVRLNLSEVIKKNDQAHVKEKDFSEIHAYRVDEKRSVIESPSEKKPIITARAPSVLLIKLDEFVPNAILLLRQLIRSAIEKGCAEVRFFGKKSLVSMIDSLALDEDIIIQSHVHDSLSIALEEAKTGLATADYLEIRCEKHQSPESTLLVAFYCLGDFNDAIAFFNGDSPDLDLNQLPGFSQYQFQYNPLVTLYRPSWLGYRLGALMSPCTQNTHEEKLFFSNEIVPFLGNIRLKRRFDYLGPFLKSYIRSIFYEQCHGLIEGCDAKEKERAIQAILMPLVVKAEEYNKHAFVLKSYQKQLEQSAFFHYKYLRLSQDSLAPGEQRKKLTSLLQQIREDLSTPFMIEMQSLIEVFQSIVSLGYLPKEKLNALDRHLKIATEMRSRYEENIGSLDIENNKAVLAFIKKMRPHINQADFFEELTENLGNTQMPNSWLDVIGAGLKNHVQECDRFKERKAFCQYLVRFLKNKTIFLQNGFAPSLLESIDVLREQILESRDADYKQFYSILLVSLFREKELFNLYKKDEVGVMSHGLFDSIEKHRDWVLEQQTACVEALIDSIPWKTNGPYARQFYEQLAAILESSWFPMNLKQKLCDAFCEAISLMEATSEHKTLCHLMIDVLTRETLPRRYKTFLVDALMIYISSLAWSIAYPASISDREWAGLERQFNQFYRLSASSKRVSSELDFSLSRRQLVSVAHQYFEEQVSAIEEVMSGPLTKISKADVGKRLDTLQMMAEYFERNESVSFPTLKLRRLVWSLSDIIPEDDKDAALHEKTRRIEPLMSPYLVRSYLMRASTELPVLPYSSGENESLLLVMNDMLLSEAKQLLPFKTQADEVKSLSAVFEFFDEMTSSEKLSDCDESDLRTLSKLKLFFRKLDNFSMEMGAKDFLQDDESHAVISHKDIHRVLVRIRQSHAKLFLSSLKHYLEKQCIEKKWTKGFSFGSEKKNIEIAGQTYTLPLAVWEQYQMILKAFPTDGADTEPNYIEIEKAVLSMPERKSGSSSFSFAKGAKAYFNWYRLPHATVHDLEEVLMENLALDKISDSPLP